MKTRKLLTAAIILLVIALQAGCEQSEETGMPPGQVELTAPEITNAVAVLHPTEGNAVRGIVRFERSGEGIRITADIRGLPPGEHGFHIHEFGDCSAPDGTSAGGHFNPEDMPHGGPDDVERHVGDLGNLTAGADSTASYDRVDSVISFTGQHSIIGRAVMVHAGRDDLTTQPTGDAGGRIACGVIGIGNPE